MSEGEATPADRREDSIGRYISRPLYEAYALVLLLSVVILIAGVYLGRLPEVFITLPVIVILIDALLTDREIVHIPPFMIFLMVGLMGLIIVGRFFGESYFAVALVNFLFGVVMGLGGMIITYSFMTALPELNRQRPVTMIFVSISVALSLFIVLTLVHYYLYLALEGHIGSFESIFGPIRTITSGYDDPAQTIGAVMEQLLFVLIGAFVVSVAFYFGRNSGFVRRLARKHLDYRVATIGVEEYERMEIKKALDSGESERVEYKSTLRTNLGNGEKDDKIEKMVLKTLVAFLNSRGGTLLIGVSDDGTVSGIDEYSFENRDKLNLHLTNLIASKIGNEFLPFITFRLSEYQGKGVMRVVCRKSETPVFLWDGKREAFYVRSGPSSVELQGQDTLNYVNNHFKKKKG
ncbi:MAG: ATP-binding protein [Methanomassiliicoccaceae archaeon]|nr:ATP-binding protein [Methanomassiliicoccaceae archaeon]